MSVTASDIVAVLDKALAEKPNPKRFILTNISEANAAIRHLLAENAALKSATPPASATPTNAPAASVTPANAPLKIVSMPTMPPSKAAPVEILAELAALSDDSIAWNEFYRANKSAIDHAHRVQAAKPPPPPQVAKTGTVVDQLNAITEPRRRIEFYRANREIIDAFYSAKRISNKP